MTLDPRWSIILSLFLAILAVMAGASAQLTDLGLAPTQVKAILALITLFLGIGNAVNAVLGAIPSAPGQTKGFFLGPKPADPPPPAAKP
jgi:hypothetical protein